MAEICLRTALISWMIAPHSSSSPVMACFSASVTGAAGAGSRAEPPPDITRDHQVALAGLLRYAAMRRAPPTPASSGFGMAALVQFDAAQLVDVTVLNVDQAARNAARRAARSTALAIDRARLTGAEHEDPVERVQLVAPPARDERPVLYSNVSKNCFERIRRRKGGAKYSEGVSP